MDNETVYLPGKIRDRIQDLMKSRKVTQAELAAKIGCSESALSRFISGKTDKLGDESIIRIARAFEESTDFLLSEVDEPDRKNYDISELGLSVEAARNLYTQKVNPQIVSYLLENPQFADTTYQIARYLDNELTAGFAAQNQLYSMVSSMLGTAPQAADEVKSLRTPIDQADLSAIQNSFMKAVRAVKKEAEAELPPTRQLTAQDYEEYDLLIGMEGANLKNMQRICGGDPAGKMHRLLDYTARPGDVADPWYTGDFEATWRDVSEGCKCLLAEIEKSGI